MNVLVQVRETIEEYDLLGGAGVVVVGVSGGPDSLCLLHVLRELGCESTFSLHVAHLDHGIRGAESQADAAFVSNLAEQWNLPATIKCIDVPQFAAEEGLALEEAARRVRYRFLAAVSHQVGAKCIAVGHNADDQVETVLMHFLRGSGLSGLRGMLHCSRLDELRLGEPATTSLSTRPRLIRPLLDVPRSAIEVYCHSHGLCPRFDRSNLDSTYFRNRLRHTLIPALEAYNPNIRETLRRTARVMAADHELLRRELQEAWGQVVRSNASDEDTAAQVICFDLEGWRSLPLSLRRSTLREAIHQLRRSLRNINLAHVENARKVAEGGETGNQVTLPGQLTLVVGYDHLLVAEKGYRPRIGGPSLDALHSITVPGITHLPGGEWRLVAELIDRSRLSDAALRRGVRWEAFLDADVAGQNLVLRPRRSEDRVHPLGMSGHSQRVQDLMVNSKVPALHRDRVPLLVAGDRVLWVCGWCVGENAKVRGSTQRILWLRFERELLTG